MDDTSCIVKRNLRSERNVIPNRVAAFAFMLALSAVFSASSLHGGMALTGWPPPGGTGRRVGGDDSQSSGTSGHSAGGSGSHGGVGGGGYAGGGSGASGGGSIAGGGGGGTATGGGGVAGGGVSSVSNAPADAGEDPPSGPAEPETLDPVGYITGSVYDTAEDLRVRCPDVDLVFRRAYGSWSARTGSLGYGWTHAYEWRLVERGGNVSVYSAGEGSPSDAVHSFAAPDSGSVSYSADGYGLVRRREGGWELSTPDALRYAFDSAGALSSIRTWNGTSVSIVRDGSGRLVRAVHSCGSAIGFEYDAEGFLTCVTTPDPSVRADIEVGSFGPFRVLSSVVCSDGASSSTNTFAYSAVPRPGTRLVYEPGAIRTVSRGGGGSPRPVLGRKTDANGRSSLFRYIRPSEAPAPKCAFMEMDGGLFSTVLDYGNGVTVESRPTAFGISRMDLRYDDSRRETSRRTGAEVRTREYSSAGDMVAERLENLETGAFLESRTAYDSRHRVISAGTGFNAAPSHFTSLSWDDRRCIPGCVVTPCGRVSEWRTNGLDVTVYGAGAGDPRLVTHVLMTPGERPREILSPDGGRIEISYDSSGYVDGIAASCLPPVSFGYDALGNLSSVRAPGPGGTVRVTGSVNNWRGRPRRISRPDGTSESFLYDGNGRRVVRHVDALGREDVYKWVLGLPVHAGRILGGTTNTLFAVDHDSQLNVVAIIDPLGRRAETYVLDENERIVAVTNVEGQAMSRTYAVGKVVSSETRFDGTYVSYAHDADGNIAAVAYPGDTLSFGYDADGLLASASNAVGSVSNEYDMATGWLASSEGADGTTVSYAHSLGGAVTSVVSAAGTTAYSRDAAGRWTHLTSPAASFGFGYCGWNGRLAAVTNGNGLVTMYTYDVMDRVTNISWRTADGVVIGGFEYEYDAIGRIVSRSHALGTDMFDRAYTYDDFDRLATDGGISYVYDAAGNRTSMTDTGGATVYTLGTGDRLASWTGGAYTHDTAGNVTRIERIGRLALDLAWNSQYQLASVSTNGVFAESYTYDALNRRVSTTTLEGTVRHVYDDSWQVIADLDEQGNVVAAYVWGEGIDNLLAVTVDGATYYALTDVQGTVWGYVDSQNDVVARWQYDAWGNVIAEDVSVPALARLRYRFQSREWSAATGLINFRMRWYDPETGRWLSKDPIGLSGGLNLYVFCENNPLAFCDSYGTAKVGNRGLRGAGSFLGPLVVVPGLVLPMRLTNTFPEHRHIFFDNGENIGWGPDGFFCDENPSDGYTMKGSDYNDDILRKAVKNVKLNWKNRGYNGLFHNCQDFVDAVLDEYDRLLQ